MGKTNKTERQTSYCFRVGWNWNWMCQVNFYLCLGKIATEQVEVCSLSFFDPVTGTLWTLQSKNRTVKILQMCMPLTFICVLLCILYITSMDFWTLTSIVIRFCLTYIPKSGWTVFTHRSSCRKEKKGQVLETLVHFGFIFAIAI